MLIYTLQFPQIELKNRIAFLNFVQRNVIEFAFRHTDTFVIEGLTPEYFHKNVALPPRSPEQRIPVHIHSLVLDGVFTLRAYGNKAVKTLQLWSTIFLNENPEYRDHIVEHTERLTIERLDQPLHYVSNNWIPFRDMQVYQGFYADAGTDYTLAKTEKYQAHFALNKQLFNNLGTFLRSHHIDIHRDIALVQYPSPPKQHIALRTKIDCKTENIYKQAFSIEIKTHIRLPMIFSLGQNVGYGNGVFRRLTT